MKKLNDAILGALEWLFNYVFSLRAIERATSFLMEYKGIALLVSFLLLTVIFVLVMLRII